MAEPPHEVLECRASGGGESLTSVAQIVKPETGHLGLTACTGERLTYGVAAHWLAVAADAHAVSPGPVAHVGLAGGHYRWDLPVLREQVRRLGRPASDQTAAEDIARVIHAANRELPIVQGDPRPSPPWDEAPEYQVRENVASVVAALADPGRTPELNHQGWYERLIADGWRHGPVKDEAAKTHPDLVPFDQLPEHEKQKDRLFMAIVRALTPEPTVSGQDGQDGLPDLT